MLKHLTIKNYALIESLDMGFDPGLNIITGETGAGKSILLGALALILGQRADVAALKDPGQKCVVEGVFEVSAYALADFFAQELPEVDHQDEAILRRVVNPNGKSRAFVNDSPVGLQQLKRLGERLVDVHSQHQTLQLADNLFQLRVLDSFAANAELREAYRSAYEEFRAADKALKALRLSVQQEKDELDYLRHRLEQLAKAQLRPDEQQRLEQELETQEHALEIKASLLQAADALDQEQGLLRVLQGALSGIEKIQGYLPQAREIHQRLESAYIELKELAREMEDLGQEVEHDPRAAEKTRERLDLLYGLQQQHRVASVEELIAIREQLQARVGGIEGSQERVEALEARRAKAQALLAELSLALTKTREATVKPIGRTLTEQARALGMPHALLRIELAAAPEPQPHGQDHVEFLFTANKAAQPQPLSKVASGGELSRVMLSLKALMARTTALPTIVFDEIDTGVSGDIAARMGEIMRQMAQNMQVFAITHLPQVAAKGQHHYLVFKRHGATQTTSHLKRLDPEQRVEELAKMLSGSEVTQAALDNAKALLAP